MTRTIKKFALVLLLAGRCWAVNPPISTAPKLFLDASTLALTDGSAVSSWSDSSGQGNNAGTFSGSHAAVFKTNIIGTFPAVRFGANSNDGLGGSFTSFTSGNATILLAIANIQTPNAAFGGGFSGYNSSLTNDYDNASNLVVAAFNNDNRFYTTSVSGSDALTGTVGAGGQVISLKAGSSVVTAWINGVKMGVLSAAPVPNWTNYVIGQRFVSGARTTADGGRYDLSMLLVYDAALSDADIIAVSRWMMGKLGMYSPTGNKARAVNSQ